MSYRDLRNFTEMMKALGYPRLISMDNFRTPNFTLVAELLSWLINRYDPTVDLPTDIETEQDRVIFIKSSAQFLASKAHIKLNTKKLYCADGYAVKELLKISSILYSAMKSNKDTSGAASGDTSNSSTLDTIATAGDLKACRQLASEVTAKGAKLYGLLGKEIDLREQRKIALSKSVDIERLESGIQESITAVNNEIERVTTMLNNLASDEANLSLKIEKKRQDLERNQKRLHSLSNVRPAFLDEYEKLEQELAKQYDKYMEKHCNLCYIENLLDQHNKTEQGELEATEHSLRKVQMRMAEAERKMMQDDIISDDMLMVATSDFFGGGRPADQNEVRVTEGNMGDGEVESDNDDPGSLSSDSDFDDSVGGMGNKGRIKDHGDDFGTDGNF